MEHSRLLDALSEQSSALLDAARSAGPGAAVPGCPDWVTEDLVWHVAGLHDFWTSIVGERAQSRDGYQAPDRPDGWPATIDFASGRAAALHSALAGADPAQAVWTWSDDHSAGWVTRRMAHETAVHRIDAEAAAGRTVRLDPELAADGVDEFLMFLLVRQRDSATPLGGTVHLHCTDTEGEWTVAQDAAGTYTITREHAKGDVAVRGDAHDLLMLLWRRTGLDVVTLFGDPELAARFVQPPGHGDD